ncbi:dienelactone hydrolase family protein [Rhodococcus artemisiae]|uniref:Dienelactone hydrolase family protein n=1 Tax=Rhodococcus artemisiae TaxID=714159 RepID=A0ABU7L9R9_9NOCA|nr:dienelactone hydrolase family protein [Rhodococcus artemisiae]MEE2058305.1 dienelactone hydrolase family protein [Rhodococcus artemisiae]
MHDSDGRAIVETMPELSKDAAPLAGEAGELPLTVVRPDVSPRGCIVLLHRARVFSPTLLEFMEALADERWLIVAPDLHSRGPGSDEAALFAEAARVNADATFAWITAAGIGMDMVGLLGFDEAGTAAMWVGTTRPVGAVVSVAAPGIVESLRPVVPPLVDLVRSIRAPWLGLYGIDDPNTPRRDVEQLSDSAAKADAPTLVVSYEGLEHRPDEPPATHSTADPDEDPREAAIIDARRRIFDWFDSNLR